MSRSRTQWRETSAAAGPTSGSVARFVARVSATGMSSRWRKVTRRELLAWGAMGVLGGAAGLLLGYRFGVRRERWRKRWPDERDRFRPNVFVAIEPDGEVVVWLTKAELGQGVMTSLPMIVADELDADWSRVRVQLAIANLNFGDMSTVTSASVRSLWGPLREAGATARTMLIGAAADYWGIAPQSCSTANGRVVHPDGRQLEYGALALAAATRPLPQAPALRGGDAPRRSIVGRSLPRLDIPAKVEGSARFAIDVRLPGQLFAVTARPAALGGEVRLVDDAAARAMPGVVDVVSAPFGIAVVADTTWTAARGRGALVLERTLATDLGDEDLAAALRQRATGPTAIARDDGSGPAPPEDPALKAEYELPYLAHAPMETITCTARVEGGRCEVWAATQDPLAAQAEAISVTNLEPAAVIVYPTFAGGGFGRRVFHPEVREAVWLSERLGRPVQSVWLREDDLQHDYYRPASLHRCQGRFDADASSLHWYHHVICPSIPGQDSATGLDELAVDGAAQLPYAVARARVEWTSVPTPVPLGFWRSVGHSHTAFAIESFIDELAWHAGLDPLAARLQLLHDQPRHRAVLERVAAMARWGQSTTDGLHRGLAVHACFGSVVAQVVEVSVGADRSCDVTRVWAAVHCGRAIHPDGVVAQIEGGIIFGLTAALHGRVAFSGGQVRTANFDDYGLLRMRAVPDIEVAVIPSEDDPGGVGEIGVPPVAPALANALAAATGLRFRRLPLLDDAGRLDRTRAESGQGRGPAT
ncbi:MAG: xanthine dehydrogenase family protein molybdopterin-binding subunit [Myxococcales bacterium FL481]|nr:MAG: xanthine dehydrogenase family protein molybdopterin-binding subunit [Myxococcales bacterium FL481]